MIHQYILITGLMGSGKSTIIREFIIENDVEEFTPPPVEAKFRGMDFEFIDQIFSIQKNDVNYNFYELDAPTVSKWTQFISIANAVIVVFNYKKEKYYESPDLFIDSVVEHLRSDIPLIFVVSNCDVGKEKAKKSIEKFFNLHRYENLEYEIKIFAPGKQYFSEQYGIRIELDSEKLKSLYENTIKRIDPKSDE